MDDVFRPLALGGCAAAKAGEKGWLPGLGTAPAGTSSSLVNCQPCCRSNSETRCTPWLARPHITASAVHLHALRSPPWPAPDLSPSASAPRFYLHARPRLASLGLGRPCREGFLYLLLANHNAPCSTRRTSLWFGYQPVLVATVLSCVQSS